MATLRTDFVKGSGTPTTLTVGDASDTTNLVVKGAITQQSGSNTFVANSISGDAIDGGTISDFRSTGIDDGSTSGTAITIATDRDVTLAADLSVTGALAVSGATTLGDVTVTGSLDIGTSGVTVRSMVEFDWTATYAGGIASLTTNTVVGALTGSGASIAITGSGASSAIRCTFSTASGVAPSDTNYFVSVSQHGQILTDTYYVAITKQTAYFDIDFNGATALASQAGTATLFLGGW